MKSMITKIARQKLVEARLGTRTLAKVAGIAIGDGAAPGGTLTELTGTETGLKNELVRKPYETAEKTSDTSARYRVTLGTSEQAGKQINEIALYDTEGDILAIRVFENKIKDADMEMIFEIEDQF